MKHIVLKALSALISIFLLLLLGIIGERLIYFTHSSNIVQNVGLENLPYISQLFYSNFLLNSGHFTLSLTPFVVLIFANICFFLSNICRELYWAIFCSIWLLAITYFLLFVVALILPFNMLGVVVGESMVPTIAIGANIFIAFLSAIYIIFKRSMGS